MALKFNPFTGTLDFVGMTEAQKGEFVTKATEQSVTGKKTWEAEQRFITTNAEVPVFIERTSPPAVSGAVGTNALTPITILAPNGGETTIKTSGTGGIGGPIVIRGGLGGSAPGAATSSTGGAGGKVAFIGGTGQETVAENSTDKGGAGGAGEMAGGTGGNTPGITNKKNTAGNGGQAIVKGGEGGEAANSTLENIAGAGGEVLVEGGKAGLVGAAEVGPIQAAGGLVKIKGGTGATVATAKGGNVEIAGGSASTGEEKNAGNILFKTGKAGTTLQLEVTNTGFGKWTKSIGLWATAPPATQHAEIVEPAETLAGHQAALKSIREVLKEYGLTK